MSEGGDVVQGGSAEKDSSVQDQLQKVLDELRNQREEVKSLANEVHGNTLSVSSEFKKIKSDKDLEWRFKGNKLQHAFNCEIEDIVKQGLWGLEHNKPKYASEILTELSDKIKKRNKLIRIADSSEGGWDTVKLYETNPLASDSEDESRLNRAESRAIKRKKTQKSNTRGKQRSSRPGGGFGDMGFNRPSMMSSGGYTRDPQHYTSGMQSFRFQGPSWTPVNSTGRVNPGPCYACGELNHFRRD